MNHIMTTNIEALLNDISRIVAKEKTLQEERRKQGENFNIFSVLNLSTKEVRLHSAFLAELLNPDGDHGLGYKFLEAFLSIIIQRVKPGFEFDIKSAKVSKEFSIGPISEDYTEGGQIDLLIRDDKNHAIVIENKIGANDQKNQLLRYDNYAKKNKTIESYILLYLTLNRDEASEYSTCNQVEYQRISYKKDILPWLQSCIGIAALHPIVRETIRQYITNIEQITNIMSKENKDELIELLVKKENIESTMSICHCKDEIVKKILTDFIGNRLVQLAKKHGTELKYDKEFINLPKNSCKNICFINKEYPGYFQIQSNVNKVFYGIVADEYEDKKKELEQFDDWCDEKSESWPYGTKYFPGNLRLWDEKDALVDMVKGDQLINIIDEELTRIEKNHLIEKLDKEIRTQK